MLHCNMMTTLNAISIHLFSVSLHDCVTYRLQKQSHDGRVGSAVANLRFWLIAEAWVRVPLVPNLIWLTVRLYCNPLLGHRGHTVATLAGGIKWVKEQRDALALASLIKYWLELLVILGLWGPQQCSKHEHLTNFILFNYSVINSYHIWFYVQVFWK